MKKILSVCSAKLFLFFLFLSTQSFASDCLVTQGALDIGSGSTKSVVAIVDTCQKKIHKVLFEENMAVPFSEAHETSADQKIPEAFVKAQLPRMKELSQKMRQHGAVSIHALATSVFRRAKNGEDVMKKISEAISGPVQMISQEDEARLGYWSALAQRPPRQGEQVVVWDIGGGSMQMITQPKAAETGLTIYQGELAAVNFKNRVINELQKKDAKTQNSPNPLGAQWTDAVKLSETYASAHVPSEFQKLSRQVTWIGIGGVLYNSVREQTKVKNTYQVKDLQKALKKRAKLNDQQLGGDYAATDVTNLALVAGFMQALKIKKVETVKASLAQGWLLFQLDEQDDKQSNENTEKKN
ncbi:Ppx/GppA phosphatase family protein [Pseudobdellovibrio exovorus]|uniref:Ppx/GppA phosphatase N-terminal domain-containing protein n=1 Tax=Pseudobdellovibrio exovorus JSS TaxID=1184267 RepID=M4V5W0_9BACT|nr:hypothetical protein [Pseudobdellovibrio exovorus]AGH94558.1 hypothetical protein A11Q_338 [Pseudobdellovibrio exovorus JSS]